MKRIVSVLERAARRLKRMGRKLANKRGIGLADEGQSYDNLDDLAGTWIDDPEFDKIVEEIDQVDPELWR